MTTLLDMKKGNTAKEAADRVLEDRKRGILVLIVDFLTRNGYADSCARLQTESGLLQGKWEIADNIDLTTVVQQYEVYYESIFLRKPAFVRQARPSADGGGKKERRAGGSSQAGYALLSGVECPH